MRTVKTGLYGENVEKYISDVFELRREYFAGFAEAGCFPSYVPDFRRYTAADDELMMFFATEHGKTAKRKLSFGRRFAHRGAIRASRRNWNCPERATKKSWS